MMKRLNLLEIHEDGLTLLFEGSKRAIPFNTVLALLLSIILINAHVPIYTVSIWLGVVILMSLVRWFFCYQFLNKNLNEENIVSSLSIFLTLTFIKGVLWGACYLFSLPYVSELHEFIIILVFGGMCAGAITSLSVYLPAYWLYVLPMFLPVINYNFSLLNLDRSLLAMMFSLFVVMILISARLNNKLLNQTFDLSSERESLIRELKILSITDMLTGLYNRRHFELTLEKELNRGKRNHHALNLISVDVDNFKLINDNFGHPYGDQFIIYVANLLRGSLTRANDTLFRLGGDEFAAILVNMSMDEAFQVCKKIKKEFTQKIDLPFHPDLATSYDLFDNLTLSIGVVYIPFDTTSNINSAVIAVDKALYQSKQQGKNKIVLKQLH